MTTCDHCHEPIVEGDAIVKFDVVSLSGPGTTVVWHARSCTRSFARATFVTGPADLPSVLRKPGT